MKLFINGIPVNVDVRKSLGKGMEADVYKLGDKAVKVFKAPDHPDLFTDTDREAARHKIEEHQTKLPQFPKGLPSRVVVPADLVKDQFGKIVGYVMRMVDSPMQARSFSQVPERMSGLDPNRGVRAFLDLHSTVAGLHTSRVVIGDFNDLNILVTPSDESYVIDADSFQYGQFPCRMYTEEFVDPKLCDPSGNAPVLRDHHNPDSDWYAYTAMLFKTLLCIGPFGGVYRPTKKKDQMLHTQRPLRGVSVFNPDVIYPKRAVHFRVLPDPILDYFVKAFEKGQRGEFPKSLLASVRWTKCQACGLEHARQSCPDCKAAMPAAAVKERIEVKGSIKSTMTFKTSGRIVYATIQEGIIRWLYNENGKFWREDRTSIANGTADPNMRFRISGDTTIIGNSGTVIVLQRDKPPTQLAVSQFQDSFAMFDASSAGIFWEHDGSIVRGHSMGLEYSPEKVGQVLDGQTIFWVGEQFGVGFYRAGELCMNFVFDTKAKTLNDSVQIPKVGGQLVGTRCVFGGNRAALLFSFKDGTKVRNRCVVLKSSGEVVGIAEADEGDGSWLSSIRGKCIIGDSVMSATDDGIIKVDFAGGADVKETRFDGSENFVDSGCTLLAAKDGLCCVSDKEIRILQVTR
jgi:hypothetical protein